MTENPAFVLPAPSPTPADPAVSLPRRLAFRFVFVFLGTFFWPMPFDLLGPQALVEAYWGFWQALTPWVGQHVLGLAEPIAVAGTGSSDRMHDWVMLLCRISLALGVAVVWSLLDRRPRIHPWWREGLRIYLRFGLGMILITYGITKLVPGGQFPLLRYDDLINPLGRYSPMSLLWTFMGYSRGYTIFTGAGEIVAGLLLLFRRTALLGALLSAAVLTHVVALNVFYDVPVKLFSSQLLLTALYLVLPDARRLAAVLVLHRAVPPGEIELPRLPLRGFAARRFRLAAALTKMGLVGFFLFQTTTFYEPLLNRKETRRPFQGFYDVVDFEIAGQERPAGPADPKSWTHVLISPYAGFTVQTWDNGFYRFAVRHFDKETKRIHLAVRRDRDEGWLEADQQGDLLVLQGEYLGDRVRATLRQIPDPGFTLTSRGFQWVSEAPYQRR